MDREWISRFGGAPLAIALEHINRFPKRSGEPAEAKLRARAMMSTVMQANAIDDCEAVWTRLTCGYFKRPDGLAIIPIWGDLGPMRMYWPWVWYEDIAAVADAVAKDGDVKAVLWHVDSPGGYVTGIADCVGAVEAARTKPSAVYVSDYACSAAYWLSCAFAGPGGRISGPASAIVQSIGTLCLHEEITRMLENAGVSVKVFRSKPRKAEANPFEQLSAVAATQIARELKACDEMFDAAVARLRGVDLNAVAATQGACATIADAVRGKFADGVEAFDQACAALLAKVTAQQSPHQALAARAARAARHRLSARLARAS